MSFRDTPGVLQGSVVDMVKKIISETRKQALQFIGATVRDLRKDRGLSLQDLAAALQIEGSTLGKFERGEVFLSLPNLSSIADFFGIELSDLFKRDFAKGRLPVAGELGRQPRFKVLGTINAKMPGLSSEQLTVISVPLEGGFSDAYAFRTENGGYMIGEAITEDFAPANLQRFVILRLNINSEPSLHVAGFLRSSTVSAGQERVLLDRDARLGKLVHIHDSAELHAAIAAFGEPQDDLPITRNEGWLLLDGVGQARFRTANS